MKSAEYIREKEKQQQLTGSQVQSFAYRRSWGFLKTKRSRMAWNTKGLRWSFQSAPFSSPPHLSSRYLPPHPNSFYPMVKLPKPPTGERSDRKLKKVENMRERKGKQRTASRVPCFTHGRSWGSLKTKRSLWAWGALERNIYCQHYPP